MGRLLLVQFALLVALLVGLGAGALLLTTPAIRANEDAQELRAVEREAIGVRDRVRAWQSQVAA